MASPTKIIEYHTPSTAALEAMLAACMRAEESIKLEEFILADDTVGMKFIHVFKQKAYQGVRVQLLIDGWGGRELKKSRTLKSLKEAGVEVAFHSPFKWWKPASFLPRDHRKIMLIDEKTAFIGGVCLCQKVKNWHDMMIELTGGIAEQLNHVFDQSWQQITAPDAEPIGSHPHFETEAELTIYANSPETDEPRFTEELFERIKNAKHSIKLVAPYFAPTKRISKLLVEAEKRGVEVEIILSRRLDYTLPYYLAKYVAGKFLKAGANIYYYHPSPIHLKSMVIDGQWAALGSCNVDGLSIRHNREVMLAGTRKDFVDHLSEEFECVKRASQHFDTRRWKAQPTSHMAAGFLLQPFRNYL